jgi:hypothetical protein
MANTGLWLRTTWRTLRTQSVGVRVAAGATALLLGAGVVSAGGRAFTPDSTGGDGEFTAADRTPAGITPGRSPNDTRAGTDTQTVPSPGTTGTGATGTIGGTRGPGATTGTRTSTSPTGSTGSTPDPSRTLTASDRGVTPTTVKVVFPWFDIAAYTSVSGTTTEEPLESGPDAIKAFVGYINANGGLDGRRIDAQIENFNPLNEPDMRARCRRWAEDDKVFAVIDSSAWHSDHQLCITEDHDTPLVTNLGLTKEWTKRGAPYLWWTAPNSEETIDDWVLWAKASGQIDSKTTIGVVTGEKEEEELGRKEIERALKEVGLLDRTTFERIPGYTSDIAVSNAAIPGAVARMKQKGVNRLFMGLSALVFTSWMAQADSQEFAPRYLLSDFNSTITVAEALLAGDHPHSLKGAIGPTYIRLGEKSVKNANGVYTPTEQLCNDVWQKANPKAPKMDRAGIAARWCDNIFAFAEGARRASSAHRGVLTRKNWAEAMPTIQALGSAMTAELSWASGDYSGVTRSRVVTLVTQDATYCHAQGDVDDACHKLVEDYRPMRHF